MKEFFKDTRPGGQLLALGFLFVLFFILSVGVGAVVLLFSSGVENQLVIQAVTQIVSFAAVALLFAYLFYDKPLRYLGLPAVDGMAGKLMASFLVLICLLPMSDWLSRVNDAWHLPQGLAALEEAMRSMGNRAQELIEAFLTRKGVWALVGNVVVFALVPAICEELFFRGALQQLFCKMIKNPHVAIWFTAALFSLFHGEIFAFLPRFVLGAALGYLFYYGGSLWFNATAHFFNNALSILFYYLANVGAIDSRWAESINAPWYLAVIGMAMAVLIFVFAFVRRKKVA